MSVALIPSPRRIETQIQLATSQPRWTKQWVNRVRDLRWRARHDLLFLCNGPLGYPDVTRQIHGSMIDILQRFPEPTALEREEYDQFHGFNPVTGRPVWVYRPLRPMLKLEGVRRRMILHSRGSLKTTINTIAHSAQWIINYPEVIILFVQATDDLAQQNLNGILKIWRGAPAFRELFPEHVPWHAPMAFGSKNSFVTRCAPPTFTKEDYTVATCSVGKAAAGTHCHVIKFADVVSEANSLTEPGLQGVIDRFGLYYPILISSDYWIDVEGTRYSHLDLYGDIQRKEEAATKKEWIIHARGCYLKKRKDGKPLQHTLDELDEPDLLDENGKRISYWPERHKVENLERIRISMGDKLFACQYRNNPTDVEDKSLIPFPPDKFLTISRENFTRNVRVAFRITTVDTAEGSGNSTSDSTAITTCAWDKYGKCYVEDLQHGMWLPDPFIELLFDVYRKFNPAWVAVEEVGWVLGLKPSIQRRIDLDAARGGKRYPQIPFRFVRRENDRTKTQRILLTLNAPYMRGDLIFLDDIPCLEAVRKEFLLFPAYHDDILDTLSDQWQTREWFGKLEEDPVKQELKGLDLWNENQRIAHEMMQSNRWKERATERYLNDLFDSQSTDFSGPMPPLFKRTGL